jgi:hypothetical protein
MGTSLTGSSDRAVVVADTREMVMETTGIENIKTFDPIPSLPPPPRSGSGERAVAVADAREIEMEIGALGPTTTTFFDSRVLGSAEREVDRTYAATSSNSTTHASNPAKNMTHGH